MPNDLIMPRNLYHYNDTAVTLPGHIVAIAANLTTQFLDLRPPHDQRKLCDRAEVQTHGSAVRGAVDCASEHSAG